MISHAVFCEMLNSELRASIALPYCWSLKLYCPCNLVYSCRTATSMPVTQINMQMAPTKRYGLCKRDRAPPLCWWMVNFCISATHSVSVCLKRHLYTKCDKEKLFCCSTRTCPQSPPQACLHTPVRINSCNRVLQLSAQIKRALLACKSAMWRRVCLLSANVCEMIEGCHWVCGLLPDGPRRAAQLSKLVRLRKKNRYHTDLQESVLIGTHCLFHSIYVGFYGPGPRICSNVA